MAAGKESEDARAPLLVEGEADAFIRAVCEKAKNNYSHFWEAFEKVDCPVVEYDASVEDETAPMINSLMTFITVTTFIAGFAVSDFGSFEAANWSDEEGELMYKGYAFLIIMAFVSTHNLYLSVYGTMLAAAYYRTKNQTRDWHSECAMIVNYITEGFQQDGGFKGRRKDILEAACAAKVESVPAYLHSYQIADMSPSTTCPISLTSKDQKTWTVCMLSPARVAATKAFGLLQAYSFPVTIVLYVVAQTMKAIQGTTWRSCAFSTPAFLTAGFWMMRLVVDLRPVYYKLRH